MSVSMPMQLALSLQLATTTSRRGVVKLTAGQLLLLVTVLNILASSATPTVVGGSHLRL